MSEDELKELAEAYGKAYQVFCNTDVVDMLVRFGRDVERETRQRFYAHIQSANNAAVNRQNVRDILNKEAYK